MFWKKRASIDQDEIDWFVETWRWLDQLNGRVDGDCPRPLVLPSRTFFPDPERELQGHARAQYYFEMVKQYLIMDSWYCELKPQAERPRLQAQVGLGAMRSSGALGTYGREHNTPVVTYDPELTRDKSPSRLITLFVHELSHYRFENAVLPLPGGADLEELATDLCTVHLGFGLFGANSAFVYKQTSDFDRQGWSYQRNGYLSEPMWTFANAVFAELVEAPPDSYEPFAKSSIASGMKKNRAFLSANPAVIESLRSPLAA